MSRESYLPPENTDPLVRSAILTDPRQRNLLSLLLEEQGPLTERDLAIQLAAREKGIPPSEVTDEDVQEILTDLHHHCLPKFNAIGWIEHHPVGVVPTEQLSFESRKLSLPALDSRDNQLWEALAALVARPRRQYVVAIINDHPHSLTLKELGDKLIASEQTSWTGTNPNGEPTLLTKLHHIDLPKLADVGLIEYTSDTKTITGKPGLSTLLDRIDSAPQKK